MVLRQDRGAQYQGVARAFLGKLLRQRVAACYLQKVGVAQGIRGGKQGVVAVKHADCPHDIGVGAVQPVDKSGYGSALAKRHPVLTGDRQGFYNTGTRVDELVLQFVVAMHDKEGAEQQTDH